MIIKSDKWNEEYYYEKLSNGLEVYLMEKKEFKKTFAAMAVNFGSLDKTFIPPFQSDFVDVPLGSSHFLEHQMFESNNDVSLEFASLGAECNAYTSFDRTVYTFNTVKNIEKCTNLLLNLVQTPSYTSESIEREKNSIIQELLMYENIPNNVLYNECLKSLYSKCDVKYDICGTIESIKQINKDILDICYDTFYHPSNSCFVMVGNFDCKEIIKLIKDNQETRKFRDFVLIKRKYPVEPIELNKKKSIINYELQIPKISINLKIPTITNESIVNLKKDLALSMLVDYNFDETSNLYEQLMEKEIINHTYSYESLVDDGYSYFMINCDTFKTIEFEKEIKNKLLNLELLTEDSFNRYKNTIYAANIRKMNNLEYYVTMLIDACFCNLSLFQIFDAIDSITLDEVNDLKKLFTQDLISTVIIKDVKHQ